LKATVDCTEINAQITADTEHKEAYDETIRIKGYVISTGEWTEETKVVIPWSRESVLGTVQDNNSKLGIFAGQNGLPYDTKFTTEEVTDSETLKEYGEKLKQVAGNKFGSFYALNVELSDSNGESLKIQSATGEWGSGYYGLEKGNYEQDVEIQSEYTRQLFVYLDKSKGYWPKNTKVYYVDGDTVKELPTPKDSLLPDDYDYTFTTCQRFPMRKTRPTTAIR